MESYSFRIIRQVDLEYKNPKIKDGVVILSRKKVLYSYWGVLSPFHDDYEIKYTSNEKEAIFHTKKELYRVKEILDRKGIKYTIYNESTKQPAQEL